MTWFARFAALVVGIAALCLPVSALARPNVPAAPGDDGNRAWSVRPAGPSGKPDSRTHYTLQGAPGTTVNEQVLVSNASKVEASFAIYATDAFNTDTGAFDLLPAALKPIDIGTWVSFPAPTVTIPAGRSVAIPFTIAIPSGATPGDHTGGVLVSLASGTDVKLDTRVAVRLYLRIAGLLRPVLAAQNVDGNFHGAGNPFGHGRVAVTYVAANTGNIRLQAHVKITVRSAITGSVLGAVTPPDLPELLPRQQVTYHAEVAGVFPSGPVTVTVQLQPYPDPAQPVGQAIPAASGSTTIWAVTWPQILLALLVLAVLGVLVRLLVRRLTRRRVSAALAEAAQRKQARRQGRSKVGARTGGVDDEADGADA